LDGSFHWEKAIEKVKSFEGGRARSRAAIHPMLGKFKPGQWVIGQYKHIDHHLRQFGV